MITLLKRLGIAALALAIPAFAQAGVLLEGDTVDIFPGEIYAFDETLDLPSGLTTLTFGFTPHGTPGNAITLEGSLGSGGLTFGSFLIDGPGGPFGHTFLLEGDLGFFARIEDAALQVGQDYELILSFSLLNAAETQVNVQMSVVPLPAAGLLLLGGLGGLGLVARRRKAAA